MKPSIRIRICVVTFAVSLSLLTSDAFATRLKLATIAPERSVWGKEFKNAAKEIAKKTDGRVKLKVYFGGVQGDEQTVVKKMRIGQLQGAGFMAFGLSKVCPDSLVFSTPLMIESPGEAIWVQDKMQDYYQKKAREKGFEIIGWTRQGFTYCYSNDPIKDLDSLRTSKPWMIESDDFCKVFFKHAGISAVPVQVGDVLTGLQSGLIRTVFTPPTGMIVMQWHTRAKYKLNMGIFYSFGTVVLSSKSWKKLSPEDQKTVREVFAETLSKLNTAIDKQNKEADEVMAKHIKSITPTEEAKDELRAVSDKVAEEMAGNHFSPEALKMVREYIKQYRDKHAKKDAD